jgi:hypothetical protein
MLTLTTTDELPILILLLKAPYHTYIALSRTIRMPEQKILKTDTALIIHELQGPPPFPVAIWSHKLPRDNAPRATPTTQAPAVARCPPTVGIVAGMDGARREKFQGLQGAAGAEPRCDAAVTHMELNRRKASSRCGRLPAGLPAAARCRKPRDAGALAASR